MSTLRLSFPIWEKLGGRADAIALIESKLRRKISKGMINRWIWKRTLPSYVAAICLEEAGARGMPTSLIECELRGVPINANISPNKRKHASADAD